MSAIAGIVHIDGTPVPEGSLRTMLDSMPHRGSDAIGLDVSGGRALGHRMMYTTEESLFEQLPLWSSDKTNCLTGDARIDNLEELIGELGLVGDGEVPISDSDVILAAYQRWNTGCFEKLIGDFAFAIWDTRELRLVCVRDCLGLRPFYYFKSENIFAFATEIKALLTLENVPRELDETRLLDYLSFNRTDHENTVYEQIQRLPPAHFMIVDASGISVKRYTEIRPASNVGTRTDEEYTEGFLKLMQEAVRCRLRSAFPISSQLSGGLDSSFVTCLARDTLHDEQKEPLRTVSLVFPEGEEGDELEYIQQVIDQGGIEPSFLQGNEFGPLSDLNEIFNVLDDGIAAGNHHLIWRMLQMANQQGARVMLDGIDGDNTVGHGLGYFKELASTGKWEEFASEAKATVANHSRSRHKHDFHHTLSSLNALVNLYAIPEIILCAKTGRLRKFLVGVRELHRLFGVRRQKLIRENVHRLLIPWWLWQRRARKLGDMEPVSPLINRSHVDSVKERKRQTYTPSALADPESVREAQAHLFNSGSVTVHFETLNYYAAAHGVDLRHPFMDKRLIEYCLALPPNQSFSKGWTRIVLRRAMMSSVPDEICWRPGKGFLTVNFRYGLFQLNAPILNELFGNLGPLEHYVDKKYVNHLLSNPSSLNEKEGIEVSTVASLSLWLRKLIGEQGFTFSKKNS